MLKIEEMEKMLKEAQLEKARLIESRVSNGPHRVIDDSCGGAPVNSWSEAPAIEGSGIQEPSIQFYRPSTLPVFFFPPHCVLMKMFTLSTKGENNDQIDALL